MKFLSSLPAKNLAGKTCILRASLDIEDAKKSFRLQATLPTLKFLVNQGSRIIMIGQRGRPKKKDLALSMRVVMPFFRRKLKQKIDFLPDFNFEKIRKQINSSKPGSIFLLENIRFLPGETENDPELGRSLASLADFYVNDDFATSHRNHASFVQIPRFLPSYGGLLMQKELENLDKILKSTKKPFIVIIGGAKVPEKLGVIKNLMGKADWFLVGGVTANTILKAKGFDINRSDFDSEMVKTARQLINNKKIILPFDFISEKRKFIDIGPLTSKAFVEKIKTAKTILWNGPMGRFEDKKSLNGSRLVAQAVARSRAFSLVGGGDTTELIQKLGLEKKIGFMSTGGGAMLEYLGGKELPGIKALR